MLVNVWGQVTHFLDEKQKGFIEVSSALAPAATGMASSWLVS
jgi:hypothetical protein